MMTVIDQLYYNGYKDRLKNAIGKISIVFCTDEYILAKGAAGIYIVLCTTTGTPLRFFNEASDAMADIADSYAIDMYDITRLEDISF